MSERRSREGGEGRGELHLKKKVKWSRLLSMKSFLHGGLLIVDVALMRI